MLAVGGWIVLGLVAAMRLDLGKVFSVLPESLGQALTALAVVGVVCAVALLAAGVGTLLGHRQALMFGSLSAAIYSGAWWLGVALMPWHPAMAMEGAVLLLLISAPRLSDGGRGRRPGGPRLAAILVAFWLVILGAYAVMIGTVTEPGVRRLAAQPLATILQTPANAAPRCQKQWRDQVCVPAGFKLKARTPQVSAWHGPGGATFMSMPGTAFASSYKDFGFADPFSFEQAVWSSHVHPGVLVVIKDLVSDGNGREELYVWETPKSRGFLTVRRRTGNGQWFASADVYPPDGSSYTLMSQAPQRAQALAPLLASIAQVGVDSR
jgi:hypothetical protein